MSLSFATVVRAVQYLAVIAILGGCASSKFIPYYIDEACKKDQVSNDNGQKDQVSYDNGQKACRILADDYAKNITRLERSERGAQSTMLLAGIAGVYQGVTGANSTNIAGYAATGTLAYGVDQFLIRRPTRTGIYLAGMEQLNCLLLQVGARQKLLDNYPNGESDINRRIDDAKACPDFRTSREYADFLETVSTYRGLMAKLKLAKEQLGLHCNAVAINVSRALNQDTPGSNALRQFLSSVDLGLPEEEGDPDAEDGAGDPEGKILENGECQANAETTHTLLLKLNTALAGMAPERCIKPIVVLDFKLAILSPLELKKPSQPSTHQFAFSGGTAPFVINELTGGDNKPQVGLSVASDKVEIKMGPATDTGLYRYQLQDAAGRSLPFSILVNDEE